MKRILTYIVLAYAWSWAWWIPLATSGVVATPGNGWPTHLIGLAGPAIAAFITVAAFDGRSGLRDLWARITRWRVRWYWWAGIGATAIAWLVAMAMDPVGAFIYSGAAQWGIGTVIVVLILNGFGEEIGWRGFLADGLLNKYSTAVTALVVWVIWGVWHLPLFWVVENFMQLGVGGTIGWGVGLLSGSIFLTWYYRGAQRSILIVALWHTLFNFGTATQATAGVPAAVLSTVVMVVAFSLLFSPRMRRRPTQPVSL